jgi:hypothetical protein
LGAEVAALLVDLPGKGNRVLAVARAQASSTPVTLIGILAAGVLCAMRPIFAADGTLGGDRRVITFSGYEWSVKDSHGEHVGPGPNLFDAANVRVENGELHLRVDRRRHQWSSAEVVSAASFGYGQYSFTIARDVADLDPDVVFGLFTWSDEPAYAHREIDIEVSRWGIPGNANTQCVVQPYDRPGSIARFSLPSGQQQIRYSFTWLPDDVTCRFGNRLPFKFEHRFTGEIPVAGGENARLNLWQFEGRSPVRNRPVEVVVSGFEFTPARNLAPDPQ